MSENEIAPAGELPARELFSLEIATQMARALGANSEDDARRLHEILNDFSSLAGSIAYSVAVYLLDPAPRPVTQRKYLEEMLKAGEHLVRLYDDAHWQVKDLVAAGYARDDPVFTATAHSISSPSYIKLARDFQGIRNYVESLRYVVDNIDSSSKKKNTKYKKLANHLIETYENFTGQIISGERSEKRDPSARTFLELGLNHLTQNSLRPEEMSTVIRSAAEARRQRG